MIDLQVAEALRRDLLRRCVSAAVAVAFLAGAVGYYVGNRQDYPGPRSADVGFMYDMTEHHDQAIRLSNLVLMNGESPDVAVFAREIIHFQAFENGLMRRQLSVWGHDPDAERPAMAWMGHEVQPDEMPGMASEAEVDALLAARGAAADALFIALISDHHRGGVEMASAAADRATDEFVKRLAQAMARNQRSEIGELDQARARANLPSNPPGFDPDTFGRGGHDR